MRRRTMLGAIGTTLLPVVSGCSAIETTDEQALTTADKARVFIGNMDAGEFNKAREH